jgi:hypothetical protein
MQLRGGKLRHDGRHRHNARETLDTTRFGEVEARRNGSRAVRSAGSITRYPWPSLSEDFNAASARVPQRLSEITRWWHRVGMRLQAISLFFALAACGGGGGGGDVLVTDLSTASQIDLCEAFLDDFCSHPDTAVFCDDPCFNEGCQAVVENGDVDEECVGIFDDEVIDCGLDGSEAACANGPGCIADALSLACP